VPDEEGVAEIKSAAEAEHGAASSGILNRTASKVGSVLPIWGGLLEVFEMRKKRTEGYVEAPVPGLESEFPLFYQWVKKGDCSNDPNCV
jgi:hypothetical protein